MTESHDSNETRGAEPLSTEHVRKIARLAMLDPGPTELDRARIGIAAVLGYVERLQAAVDSQDPQDAPSDDRMVNALRDDTPGPTLDRGAFLSIAPQTGGPDGTYLQIPSPPGQGAGAGA